MMTDVIVLQSLRYWKSKLDVENSMSPSAKLKVLFLICIAGSF
jgi:hypothetical protein